MAASITDLFNKASNGTAPVPTTLASQKNIAAASLSMSAATGWPTTTAAHFVLYRIDTAGDLVAGTLTLWKGTLSGTTMSNLTLKSGTDQVYPAGSLSVVESMPTSALWDDLVTGLLVALNQDGTLATNAALTTNAAVLTSPKIITGINDTNNNELFKVTATASAVNEFTAANAATANGPTLSSTGGDSNIDFNIAPKGTGAFKVGGNPFAHGAGTTFSPTWTNASVGNGTLTAKYIQLGKLVFFRLVLVAGSTTTFSGAVSFTPPVTAASYGSALTPIGQFELEDAGTANYVGSLQLTSTTSISPLVHTGGGTYVNWTPVTNTVPYNSFGTGDTFGCSGSYEAA